MVTFHTYEDLPENEQVAFLEKQGMTENEYLTKRNANLKGVPIAEAKADAVRNAGTPPKQKTTFSKLSDLSPEELKEREERFAKGEVFSANRDKHREKQMLQKKSIETAKEKYMDKLDMSIDAVPSHYIGKIQFSQDIVDEINAHVDETRANAPSMAKELVGQLKNDEKSCQLEFDIGGVVGEQVKTVFDAIGSAYVQQGYNRKSVAETYDIWTNHAYAGDYNPLHDHGTRTSAGLSGFMWTKLPDCMTQQDVPQGKNFFNDASGIADGWTHMIWGLGSRRDTHRFYPKTEEYVQPKIGLMYVFPQWMKHQVLPFFGPGERRSIAMNWAVHDSEAELRNMFTPAEWKKFYDENILNKSAETDESTPYKVVVDGVETIIRRDLFKEEKHPSED